MFTHRDFDKVKDKEIFESFLAKRGDETKANFDYFPPTGLIVFHGETPVCIGFLIKSDNNTCINSDALSDPTIEKKIRNMAVLYMREMIYRKALEAGYNYITVFTSEPALVEKWKKLGYTELDTNLTYLGRVLWP